MIENFEPRLENEIFPSVFVDSFFARKIKKSRISEDIIAFILTHFHSDHLHSIGSTWERNFVICNHTNCLLLMKIRGVSVRLLRCFQHGVPTLFPSSQSPTVRITLLDADHTQGSSMVLCESIQTNEDKVEVLHTGDFRFSEQSKQYLDEQLKNKKIGTCFLDCTNVHLKNNIPTESQMCEQIGRVVEVILDSTEFSIVIGIYQMGKEKLQEIVLRIAQARGVEVYIFKERINLMKTLSDPWKNYRDVITQNSSSRISFLKMSDISFSKMKQLNTKTVYIKPTSLCGKKPKLKILNSSVILSFPCSSHSSAYELQEFKRRYLEECRIIYQHSLLTENETEDLIDTATEDSNYDVLEYERNINKLVQQSQILSTHSIKREFGISKMSLRNPIRYDVKFEWSDEESDEDYIESEGEET